MKSDEFSGKMLDDHIEVFCYCNFDYYRKLFWCFCISIYEKEKGSCSGQYCLYWNYVCAVSDTAADWQFSAYMLGVVAAFLVMYVQDRRNIYQKIFLAVTFFLSVGLRLQWQAEWMILSQKLWFLEIRLQEDNGCNMYFMLEREFWILCFVSFSLQLQSV